MSGAQHLLRTSSLQGQQLMPCSPARLRQRASKPATRCQIAKREDTYDKNWKKEFFGTGYFLESRKKRDIKENYLKQIEKKKVLSGLEKLKLLSTLEKAGLTLSKLEELKLLSTAENLGALSLVETAFETDPGTIASLSIPPFIGSIAVLAVIPDDSVALTALKYVLATVLLGGSFAFVVAAFTLASLNED